MSDLFQSIPTATPSGWHLQCLICGHEDYELVPMQEHLMDYHDLNQQDLGQSKRSPDDMTASDFIVSLPTGESYLRMLRVEKQMEIQTNNILDSVQPTPDGVIDQLLADAGDMEPVTDEQIKETVGKAKAFLNLNLSVKKNMFELIEDTVTKELIIKPQRDLPQRVINSVRELIRARLEAHGYDVLPGVTVRGPISRALPVRRAPQLQERIDKMQRHYEFEVEIKSENVLLIRSGVNDSCSMCIRRFCQVNACFLDDKSPQFNDPYGENSYAALALLIS